MMTQNPRVTEKTVTLTLKISADNMTEVYGRIAEIVKSAENSADVVSVDVRDANPKITIGATR
jgi:hypothetical protein